VLTAGGKQLCSPPLGEREQRGVRRADDEIESAVSQRFEGFRNGKQQFY
jgi:hypothetical protein